jgi:hypothetical protein
MCQRGAAKRQRERTPWPISPETLANHIVKLHMRDLERVFNGVIRALAKAGVFDKTVTPMAEGTDLETRARDRGWGQVTRMVRIGDTQGQVHEIEVTVYGWKVRLLIALPAPRFPWRSKWRRFTSMRPSGPGPWSPKRG